METDADRLDHDRLGVFLILGRFLRLFLTYCLVATCWLGIVPLVACRVHRLVFSGLLSSFASLKFLNLFSLDNVAQDIVKGTVIVAVFFCTFISLVWLREQIMIGTVICTEDTNDLGLQVDPPTSYTYRMLTSRWTSSWTT